MEQESQKMQTIQHKLYLFRRTGDGALLCPKPPRPKKALSWVSPSTPGRDTSSSVRSAASFTGAVALAIMSSSPKPPPREHWNKYLCRSRSRQQWYGNTDPEYQGVVHTEVAHVWPGVSSHQLVFSVTETVTQVSRVRLLQELCGLICRFYLDAKYYIDIIDIYENIERHMVCHVCRSFLRDISTVCHFVTRR